MKYLYLNAKSLDSDQTPRSVESDLGLYCLTISLLWDARLKWINESQLISLRRVFYQMS